MFMPLGTNIKPCYPFSNVHLVRRSRLAEESHELVGCFDCSECVMGCDEYRVLSSSCPRACTVACMGQISTGAVLSGPSLEQLCVCVCVRMVIV